MTRISRRHLQSYFAIVVVLLSAVHVDADERVVVSALGIGAFDGQQSSRLFGVGLGVNLGSAVQLNVEAVREWGRAEPRSSPGGSLNPAALPELTIVLIPIESIRQDRRLTGGLRFRFPTVRRLTPFLMAEGGVARVTERYGPNPIEAEGATFMHALMEGGGGFSVALSHRLALDTSYRYGRMLGSSGFDFHALGAGLALGF